MVVTGTVGRAVSLAEECSATLSRSKSFTIEAARTEIEGEKANDATIGGRRRAWIGRELLKGGLSYRAAHSSYPRFHPPPTRAIATSTGCTRGYLGIERASREKSISLFKLENGFWPARGGHSQQRARACVRACVVRARRFCVIQNAPLRPDALVHVAATFPPSSRVARIRWKHLPFPPPHST